jgi:hypothetical protein
LINPNTAFNQSNKSQSIQNQINQYEPPKSNSCNLLETSQNSKINHHEEYEKPMIFSHFSNLQALVMCSLYQGLQTPTPFITQLKSRVSLRSYGCFLWDNEQLTGEWGNGMIVMDWIMKPIPFV